MYFFLFYIIFNIVDFWCYCFLNLLQQSHKRCICAKLFYLWKLSATFFFGSVETIFYILRISSKFSIRFSKLIESKTSSAYIFKNFKSWLVYYNYIAKIFYCGDLLPPKVQCRNLLIFFVHFYAVLVDDSTKVIKMYSCYFPKIVKIFLYIYIISFLSFRLLRSSVTTEGLIVIVMFIIIKVFRFVRRNFRS